MNGSEVVLVPDNVVIAGQAIPQGMSVGVFDWMAGPVPLWVVIEAILALALISSILYWVLRIRSVADVAGFKDTGSQIKTGSPLLAWRLGSDLKLTVNCLNYSANCISYQDVNPNNPAIWLHVGRGGTYPIGGKNSVILSEQFAIGRDLIAEQSFINLIKYYNSKQEDPRLQINSYEDYLNYGRKFLLQLCPDAIPTSAYAAISPGDADKYLPKHFTPAFFGAMCRQDAKELCDNGDNPETFLGRYAPLLAICGVTMVLLIWAFFFPM